MNVHKNARLTPKGREAMVRDVVDLGLTQSEASRRHHTTPNPIRHKPTARRSGSSKPHFESGAYATAFENSEQRKADLPRWQHRYNWHRPHASLARQTPISRLGITEDKLLKLHS